MIGIDFLMRRKLPISRLWLQVVGPDRGWCVMIGATWVIPDDAMIVPMPPVANQR